MKVITMLQPVSSTAFIVQTQYFILFYLFFANVQTPPPDWTCTSTRQNMAQEGSCQSAKILQPRQDTVALIVHSGQTK